MHTPEMRAKRLAARAAAQAAGVKVGRYPGQPDGMRKKDFIVLRDIGLEKTKKVMATKRIRRKKG